MWDLTLPPGSEAISNGDNRIRELKTDIQTSLQTYGSFPGSDPANPKYIWTISRGNTASRPASPVSGQMYNNTQTFSLERYNGATWDNVNALPAAATVDENMLTASVAGNGLAGGAGTPLSVNAGTGLEISADTIRIAASAAGSGLSGGGGSALDVNVGTGLEISADAVRIAAAAAGDGLAGGGGSALSVNVDNSTIEINSDSLRVKDAGVTEAKLATAVVNKLGQNIGMVAIASTTTGTADVVNYTGQGRLLGVHCDAAAITITIVVDGVTVFTGVVNNTEVIWGTTALTTGAGNLHSLDIHFKTSLVVSRTGGAGTTAYAAYERQA